MESGYLLPIKPLNQKLVEKSIAEGKQAFNTGFHFEWENDSHERILMHVPTSFIQEYLRNTSADERKEYTLADFINEASTIDGTYYMREMLSRPAEVRPTEFVASFNIPSDLQKGESFTVTAKDGSSSISLTRI